MTKDNKKTSISNKVLERIKSGQVSMRPKVYFILKAILFALSAFMVAFFALYLISFITFSLRVNGALSAPGFGIKGLGIFLVSLPWILVLISIALILVLEILVRHFSFVYRKPIIYSILSVIVLVLLGSFIVDKTSFHPKLFNRAEERKLLIGGGFYRKYGEMRLHNIHMGTIFELKDNGFTIKTSQEEILTIIISSKTRLHFQGDIQEEKEVLVIGEREDNTVNAIGVKIIENDSKSFLLNKRFKRPRY